MITSNFVISHIAADIMGMADPIGQKISLWGNEGTIVGIIENLHSRSLQESIGPIIFYCQPDWTRRIYARFDGTLVNSVVDELHVLYEKYSPDYPFEFSFVDQDFERLYNNEKAAGIIALSFTVLTVAISGLGLFGLAAYTAEKRRKEISIRKIMGASAANLMLMILKDFIKLGLFSIIIGCPVAYYLMKLFLQGYAYHKDLSAMLFLITALILMIFMLLTVTFQIFRATSANPVNSLRNE